MTHLYLHFIVLTFNFPYHPTYHGGDGCNTNPGLKVLDSYNEFTVFTLIMDYTVSTPIIFLELSSNKI